nr:MULTISPECIES: hypothetical protein [Providencia]
MMVLGGTLIAGFVVSPGQAHREDKSDSVVAEYRVNIEKRDGLSLFSNNNLVRIDVVGEVPNEKDWPLPSERVELLFYGNGQAQMCQDNRCMDVEVIVKKPAFLGGDNE